MTPWLRSAICALFVLEMGEMGSVSIAREPAGAELPPDAGRAAERITAGALEGPLRFLADDLLEGRGAASRGDLLARAYIASAMAFLGLEPGAGASWEQVFEMVGMTSRPPSTWKFRATRGEREVAFESHRDFIAGSGVQKESAGVADSEVVFAGYGIQAPEFGWDDFKGASLRGKTLLLLNNDPDEPPDLFAGERRLYYGRWTYKYESAARQGAAAAIIVHTTPSAGYPWQVVQSSWTGEQFELPEEGAGPLQVKAWITEDSAKALATLGGHEWKALVASARGRDFQPVPLGIRTSIELSNTLRRVSTANVLGLLPGRDPVLKQEVVIFTAHHDHLGTGEADSTGDTIYNGALDNASGVAQLLAIGRAFVSLERRPRRSILFLAVGAEESGLLGSAYYAGHPTFPPGRIAADINFDGGNIWGRTKDVALVGLGKSSLDGIAAAAVARQGRVIVPEQFPDRGFYYRSDQFSFAKIGVPALYFDVGKDFIGRPAGWGKEQVETWVSRHYHQPSDEITPEWSFDGMVEDARLGFIAGLMIAEMDTLPAWVPGDEFEPARRRALESLEKGQ